MLPDHPTPVETGNHASDPVPVAIWTPGVAADAVERYDEEAVRGGALGEMAGAGFIDGQLLSALLGIGADLDQILTQRIR